MVLSASVDNDRDQDASDDLHGTRADGQLWAIALLLSDIIANAGRREAAKEYIRKLTYRVDEVPAHTTAEYRKGLLDVARRVENLLRGQD